MCRAAELDRRHVFEIDLQQRQVGLRVDANQLRHRDAPVGKLHPDLRGLSYDMVVGNEVPGRIDGHRGPEAGLHAKPGAFVLRGRRFDQPFRIDAGDSGCADGDRVGVAAGCGIAARTDGREQVGPHEDDQERDGQTDDDRLQYEQRYRFQSDQTKFLYESACNVASLANSELPRV